MVGCGLSAKPDQAYTLDLQADAVIAYQQVGLDRLALLTHDMGDTVGGELLARQLEGSWPVEVTRRLVTNGSIYIQMAHLSVGQEVLLASPTSGCPKEPPSTGRASRRRWPPPLAEVLGARRRAGGHVGDDRPT